MCENAVAVDTEELRTLVADALELPAEEVTDEADLVEDLQIDSLMALEIIVSLERKYGITIEEAEFTQVSTLLQVRALAESKLA